MGIRSKTRLDPSSNIVRVLIDMYVDIGDSIALQYGGSEAHKKVTASRAESSNITTGPIGKVRAGVPTQRACHGREDLTQFFVSCVAQRAFDLDSTLLQQRLHGPIEARCNVSKKMKFARTRFPCLSNAVKSGISFLASTFHTTIPSPCGRWKQTTTSTTYM
jgi:hypothetical protein